MREVYFPPVEPLSLRAGVSVVVVVPSLSQCDQSEDEAVLAVITGLKARFADDVSERVNAEGSVIEQGSAYAEAPCKHLKWGCTEFRVVGLQVVAEPRDSDSEEHWRHDVVTLKEPQLWEPNEVLYKLPTCLNKLRAQDPSNVRPPHAVDARWMHILLGVRELVVMTMMVVVGARMAAFYFS